MRSGVSQPIGLAVLMAAWASVGVSQAAELVKVIFDTDMLTGYDDVGALACLHALHVKGNCTSYEND